MSVAQGPAAINGQLGPRLSCSDSNSVLFLLSFIASEESDDSEQGRANYIGNTSFIFLLSSTGTKGSLSLNIAWRTLKNLHL